MAAIWYLLVLAPFIVIPVVWWSYRRKFVAREQIADARWQKLVNAARADPAPAEQTTAVVTAVAAAAAAAPASAAAPAGYTRKARALDPAQTVLYHLLKTSLPDHEVMAQVALPAVLEVPADVVGSAREQRLRNLTRQTVDFVICNKALLPVVAIDLPLQDQSMQTPEQDFKTRALAQAGIRYLRLSRKALPKREAVRALVLGG